MELFIFKKGGEKSRETVPLKLEYLGKFVVEFETAFGYESMD
jgi:hypothetical protein